MFLPRQGFRHAAVLLMTQRSRAIPADATSETVAAELMRLARELVALAGDMHAPPESSDWLLAEYIRTSSQLPHAFDRAEAYSSAAAILSNLTMRSPIVESRDLFLVYLPEDRLPVAAPLAVELAKRRISVAFSDYEIATREQLTAALQHGLEHHRRGVVLWTKAFTRTQWHLPELPQDDRLRAISPVDPAATASELTDWIQRLR